MRVRILLDGGAYASSSSAVTSNAASFACGPYSVENALVESTCVYTNNPPCGAMRGFGAVQVCFGHESQMDKLAAALGIALGMRAAATIAATVALTAALLATWLVSALAVARAWPDVLSNAVDPGWVPTKMGGPTATGDLQMGYLTQTWLAVSNCTV